MVCTLKHLSLCPEMEALYLFNPENDMALACGLHHVEVLHPLLNHFDNRCAGVHLREVRLWASRPDLRLWQASHRLCRLLRSRAAPPSLIGTMWSTTVASVILPARRHSSQSGSALSLMVRRRRQRADW